MVVDKDLFILRVIQLNRAINSRVFVNWPFLLVCLNETLDIGVWRVSHTI